MTREAALDPDHRVHWHLRRATLIIRAFGFGWLPFYAELVERLTNHTGKTVATIKHWLGTQVRNGRTPIDAITEPHQAPLVHQLAQGAQDLILAAKVLELARQEHVLALLAGDPLFNLFAQCVLARHHRSSF